MTELLELQSVWDEHEVFFITYHSERQVPFRSYTFGNLTERKLRVMPMFLNVFESFVAMNVRTGW